MSFFDYALGLTLDNYSQSPVSKRPNSQATIA